MLGRGGYSPTSWAPAPRPGLIAPHVGARVGEPGEVAELGPGDYICYPGDVPHVFEALEPRTQAVLVSEHP